MTMNIAMTKFSYGTAGFRQKAELMDEVVRRTAYCAALRARTLKKTLGLMVTASHNPPEDNGVKVIDFTGRMLPMTCEHDLDQFINATTWDNDKYPIFEDVLQDDIKLLIGGDTRESTPRLIKMAIEGCKLAGIQSTIFGEHTTPQLHFLVYSINHPNFSSHESYVTRFKQGFTDFMQLCQGKAWKSSMSYIDCANGVGALWVGKYLKCYSHYMMFNVDIENKSALNHMCGADFVKIHRQAPACQYNGPLVRFASLDGDADRLVYYYADHHGKFHLLDGDRIAALFAIFIAEMLRELTDALGERKHELSFGVVQTAYANGGSTRFFQETAGVLPVFANTGVKHLEESARHYDIGIYFEANGHGTVWFSSKFYQVLDSLLVKKIDSPPCSQLLHAFSRVVNQVVGDGIANYMAVECLLRYYNWSIVEWEANTYIDLPSYQIKVPVKNKELFQTGEVETILVSPPNIQQQIQEVTSRYDKARAFIRPSGTEPIVRVYAEAQTDSHANELAKELETLVLLYNS